MKKSHRIKIIFILPDTNIGGAETVCINLINSLDYDKYDPILIIIRRTGDLLDRLDKNVSVVDLGCRNTKGSLFKLVRELKHLRPQVVFTTHSRTALLVSVARIFVPKFLQISRMQSSPQAEKDNHAYGPIHRALYSWSFKKADIVVAQTEEMKIEAQEVFGLQSESIKVFGNPIRDEVIKFEKSRIQMRPVLDNSYYNIVAAGRIDPVKDYRTLIRAFFQVKESIPNAALYILGRDGTDGQEIRRLIKDLDIVNEVHLIGHVGDPTSYFTQADLFVLSSVYEGCPNVLLENYILNTPLVATRCCGIVNRLIIEGVNGFSVETKNPNELAEAIKKAYRYLERSNIKNEWRPEQSLDNFFNDQLAR